MDLLELDGWYSVFDCVYGERERRRASVLKRCVVGLISGWEGGRETTQRRIIYDIWFCSFFTSSGGSNNNNNLILYSDFTYSSINSVCLCDLLLFYSIAASNSKIFTETSLIRF